MDLKELIAAQRKKMEQPQGDDVDVVLGDELVTVTVTELRPDRWQALVAELPPRKTSVGDRNLGYNEAALPREYPTDSISVGGEPVDRDTWAELFDTLDVASRNALGNAMFGVNVLAKIQKRAELGKARLAAASTLPESKESRRGGSTGGSRRK